MKTPPFERSFASHPKAKHWSKTKNCDVTPLDVFKNSHTKYCFDCDKCHHAFESRLDDVVRGSWCPYCCVPSSKLCPKTNNCDACFKRSFASHPKAKYWSKTKNGDVVTPLDVPKNSNKKYWFDCNKCHHAFDSSPGNIVCGKWCPYCCVPSSTLCPKTNNCDFCFKKSFASHPKAKYWSKTKNGDVTPLDVPKGSAKKYGFDCGECHHPFKSSLNKIVGSGTWCPYCCVPSSKLCPKTNNCDACFKRSFASHPKAKYWSKTKNGDVTPLDVPKYSNTKYGFDCGECPHAFESSPTSIVGRGTWCPYCCVPSSTLCPNTSNCDFCFKKSFASHSKAKYWSKTNGKTPRYVPKNSNKKYGFDCDKCHHAFKSSPDSIVRGRWCPKCKNKTELKLYEAVKRHYPTLIHQFNQEWCKNINCLPFDFCIPEHNIIIELDGRQHFIQVSNWTSPEETNKNDLFKEKCANEQGYSVIRIIQEDVFGDKYDWLSKLQTEIENIINDNTIIHNIYMCENGEYDNFMIE